MPHATAPAGGTYRPASGLKGARRWRVVYEPPAPNSISHCELVDARSNIVRFGSHDSAKRRADALNAAGVPPVKNGDASGYGWCMP